MSTLTRLINRLMLTRQIETNPQLGDSLHHNYMVKLES